MLEWAIERSRRDRADLERQHPKLVEWIQGKRHPTLKQLTDFARSTRTPVGYLLLAEPPQEEVPLVDFRTLRDKALQRPSGDLLDTISLVEQRQAWYHDFARAFGEPTVSWVGAASIEDSAETLAARMREALHFGLEERATYPTWEDALRGLVDAAEDAGALVMISGVVGSNPHRRLSRDEFRGFTIVDDYAPVVFVNGADPKSAQIFTLAHELAHLWLGHSALDNARMDAVTDFDIERWCNAVAAELLVPKADLRQRHDPAADLADEARRLARRYKVSTLVILHSLFDARLLSWERFRTTYRDELERVRQATRSSGGDYYRTQQVRLGKRFTRAVIASTLEGQTLYRDAFTMLGCRKQATFDELARHVGVS
jgi:Zn-dependent peptidase ImmA (M78 family)